MYVYVYVHMLRQRQEITSEPLKTASQAYTVDQLRIIRCNLSYRVLSKKGSKVPGEKNRSTEVTKDGRFDR